MARMPGKGRWLSAAALPLGVAGMVVLPAAAATAGTPPAAATPGTVITMFSDPGDFIGGGTPQEFDKTNASFSGTVSTSGIGPTRRAGQSRHHQPDHEESAG